MKLSFFIIGGVVLIVTALLQLLVRPRPEREAGIGRYLNRTTIWAFFCTAVGLLAVLIGLGVVPLLRME